MRVVKKAKKFIRSPGEFVRDALLKRYPFQLSDRVENYNLKNHKARFKDTLRWDSLDERITINNCISVKFPIDFVFTWVDSNQPTFNEKISEYSNLGYNKPEVIDDARFRSCDELKYALRSVEEYAPWVRKIFIVTDGTTPSWLNENNEKISVINHQDILSNDYLPTFNSHVIESAIHRIDGLSEHFVYFNDDMILTRPVPPEYFFSFGGLAYVFMSNVIVPMTALSEKIDTPSEWGAKNARALIYEHTGQYMSRMFAHTFYPQLKSVCEENEQRWPVQFEICRKNRLRAVTDLLCTGFLHPHIAILTGKAIATKSRHYYFNVRQRSSLNYYRELLDLKGTEIIPFSMCLNDRYSEDGADFRDYEVHLREFLDLFFPVKSAFESSRITERGCEN